MPVYLYTIIAPNDRIVKGKSMFRRKKIVYFSGEKRPAASCPCPVRREGCADGKQACRPPVAQCCKAMYPCASPLLPGGVQNGISNPFGKQKRKWRKRYRLTASGLLLVLLAENMVFVTRFIRALTGYYNLEAVGFSLFYAALYCGGLLTGLGFGYFPGRRRRGTG